MDHGSGPFFISIVALDGARGAPALQRRVNQSL